MPAMPWRRIAFFAVVAAAVLYLLDYYRTPELALLQTTLAEFSPDVLRERQPIVLTDRIENLEAINRAWFPWNTSRSMVFEAETEAAPWRTNGFKYALVQNAAAAEPIELFLYRGALGADRTPPADATLTGVILQPAQFIVLPYRIHFNTVGKINVIGIHDWITRWLP